MIARFVPIALACAAAWAQTSKPAFEVASVKPATPLGPMGLRSNRTGGPGTRDPGTYTCQNCPIAWVLDEAYDLQPYQYSGPDWVHSQRFDFAARVPAGAAKEDFRAMLQNLLAERFKLSAHWDKKDMLVYELTVAKNGPKFQEAAPPQAGKDDDAPSGNIKRDKDGFPVVAGTGMATIPGHARIRSVGEPIAWLVTMLSGQLSSPVLDATGLKGKYDFTVSWAFEENNAAASAAGAPAAASTDLYHPALITAVQSQLGLKLEHKKGQAGVLVIDHLEKTPTEN